MVGVGFCIFCLEMPHLSQDWLPERVESIPHLGILLMLFPNRCEIWHFLRFGEGGLGSLENCRPKEACGDSVFSHIFTKAYTNNRIYLRMSVSTVVQSFSGLVLHVTMSGVCWRGREIDAGTCVLDVSATALLFPLEKERQTLKRNARASSKLWQVLDASNMSKQFRMNSTCNNAMCALCFVMQCGSRYFSVFSGGGCYSHDLLLLDLSYSLRRSRENPFCIVRNLSRRRGSGGASNVDSFQVVSFFSETTFVNSTCAFAQCKRRQWSVADGRRPQCRRHVFVFITFAAVCHFK